VPSIFLFNLQSRDYIGMVDIGMGLHQYGKAQYLCGFYAI
jgi:hypothetical protein